MARVQQWQVKNKRELLKEGSFAFEDWEVVRSIGKGSYGEVWEIIKNSYGIEKKCALKVVSIPRNREERDLLSQEMDEESVTQYLTSVVESAAEEIGTMIMLADNPNIMRCEDFDIVQYEDDKSWDIFMRLELLESLPARIKNKGMPETDEVIRLGMEIADALAYCEDKKFFIGISNRKISLSALPDSISLETSEWRGLFQNHLLRRQ